MSPWTFMFQGARAGLQVAPQLPHRFAAQGRGLGEPWPVPVPWTASWMGGSLSSRSQLVCGPVTERWLPSCNSNDGEFK